MAYLMNSYMRTNNGYVKMTENESAYSSFCCKVGEFFRNFTRKTLYSKIVCVIMDEVDGQGAHLSVRK